MTGFRGSGGRPQHLQASQRVDDDARRDALLAPRSTPFLDLDDALLGERVADGHADRHAEQIRVLELHAGSLVPVYDDGMTTATVPYPADLIVIHGPPRELGGRAGMLPQALTYARRGSIVLHAEFRDGQQPGVLVVESIWPNAAFEEGIGVNALTSADPAPPNGGAVFHDTAVWLRPAEVAARPPRVDRARAGALVE